MEKKHKKRNVTRIDASSNNAKESLAIKLTSLLNYEMHERNKDSIVLLCIGTDRATGDSLGPLVGYKLAEGVARFKGVSVFGTLEEPVHAKNIEAFIERIKSEHLSAVVVAIDASLGKPQSVGQLTVGKGGVRPGAGLSKSLPAVGDIFVTGVVNNMGAMELFVLQNTRLGVVMRMADVVSEGIMLSLQTLDGQTVG